METNGLQAGMVFVAGFLSVLSPCVLPVVPLIVTGTEQDSRLRPLALVVGLSATFMAMGVLTTLFASLLAGRMRLVEVVVGTVIAVFGILLMANVNVFKNIQVFSRLQNRVTGSMGGLLLGALMGIVWIPCVGPILSGVLAAVAVKSSATSGLWLLAVYCAGFSLPMLAAAYAAQFFREHTAMVRRHPRIVRTLSGITLVALGLYLALPR